jgi:hypothetical protein
MSKQAFDLIGEVQGDVFNGGRVARHAGQHIDLYNNTATVLGEGGKLVKLDLGPLDVHIPKTLANYAAGYRLAQGVADVASPPIVVPNAQDFYWTWNQDDAFQLVQDIAVSGGSAVKEVAGRLSNTQFNTQGYALSAVIPTELQANADPPLNIQMAYTRRIMNALLLAREFRVQTLLRTQANHSFVTVLPAGNKWNGGGSSNPVQDLMTLIENALMPITDIVMSEQVWHDFAQNPAVQKFLASKINVPGIPFVASSGMPAGNNSAQFTSILGLPPITVGAIKYKTAASSYTYIWGGDVLLLHIPPGGAPRDGTDAAASYTFRWAGGSSPDMQSPTGAAPANLQPSGTGIVSGFFVRSFYNPYRGPRGAWQIIAGHNDAEQMTSNLVSGLLIGAHQ